MAADLDSHFVLAPSLEMYFVNKDTGLPLVNGKIYFYKDQARTVPKPVYQIVTATPGGPYTYVVLPNPSELSAVGTFQDNNNNDILPYYFPYAGTPEEPGDIELYYIEVYDSMGVLQFTREAWPNIASSNVETDQDVTNFVPNGQFLLHNNVVADQNNTYIVNQISQTSTVIAQGGWSFDRPVGSTAVDLVSFIRYPTTEVPTGNPRFAVEIQTTTPAGDAYKDLRLKFPSVNTFASDTQPYNLYFEAESLNGSDISNCQIIVRKFFGTGGSATTEDIKATFTLHNGDIQKYNFSFTFGENAGKSIPADDDYVQVIMRLPGNASQTAVFTDFCITVNDEQVTEFPTQTNAQQLAPSTAGWLPTPDHDGYDLYLPVILTKTGFDFDHSSIDNIEQDMDQVAVSLHPTTNLMLCDGSQYLTADYSPLGIPFRRIQQFFFNNGHGTTIRVPIFGTGANYATAYVSNGLATRLLLITNKAGLQTVPTDGGAPTGFTFGPTVKLGAAGIGFLGYSNADGYATVTSSPFMTPALAAAGAGTSGFTITELNNSTSTGLIYNIEILTVAAAGLAGLYWLFSSNSVSYYMWFTVDGVGADPAVGGRTGINVALKGNMSVRDVAMAVAATVAAYQTDIITIVTPPAASTYFTFNANSLKYVVWYKVDGVGTQPVVATTEKYIEVDILSTDTAAITTTKTQIAINSLYFAVPDLRGVFLRGGTTDLNSGGKWDTSVISRFSSAFNISGSNVGTFELDTYASHVHQITTTQGAAANSTSASGGGAAVGTVFTGFSGQAENRPVNAFVNFSIRY